MDQREGLEFSAVRNFIALYNTVNIQALTFISHCDPPMPDTLCRLGEIEVGIEVVHTYGADEEAALRLGNRRWEDYSDEVHLKTSLQPLDVRALTSLNKVLQKKAEKRYAFSPTWLVIRNAFFLWPLAKYENHRDGILVPKEHPFERIWFLCDESSIGDQGIMRLT